MNDIKSYDFDKGKLYYKYNESDDYESKLSIIIIISNEDIIKLIESNIGGYIKIWNFHTGILINKIQVLKSDLNESFVSLYGICLWDNELIFVGCGDKTIKLIDLEKGIVLKSLYGHNESVISIKKFFHPKYGECLISLGEENDNIKLWTNKKIKSLKKSK